MKPFTNPLELTLSQLENFKTLLELIETKTPNVYMRCYVLCDSGYHDCKTPACLIGHAYHQNIGKREYEDLNNKMTQPDYHAYSVAKFAKSGYSFKDVDVWSYFFAAYNVDDLPKAVARIKAALYGTLEDVLELNTLALEEVYSCS
jgi:hypothetical protein